MVSPRVTAILLETAPVALVAVLAGWAFWDFLGIPPTLATRVFIGVLLLGFAALVLGLRFRMSAVRRTGLGLVAMSYLGAHLFLLPFEPATALGFITLVFVAMELRILAERFAPILLTDLDAAARGRVMEALSRSLLRILAASAVGFFGSTLTADLALSGALPLRSIATAIVLSIGLIAVVLLLAVWPLVEQRLRESEPVETLIQMPK